MSNETTAPEVETPAPIVPGSPEYNAQLAAEGAVATGRVPEKFRAEDGTVNVEAMAQAYSELEKQFHQPKATEGVAPTQETTPDEPVKALVDELRVPEVPEPEVIAEAPKELISNEEMHQYVQEIMAKGDITDESRTTLGDRGIPKSLIDSMVTGHRATMQQQFSKAEEIVGGQERLNGIFSWAANNLSIEERGAINAGLASPTSEATLLGLAALYDRAAAKDPKAAEPKEAKRYSANPTGRQSVQGYGSKHEMYTAMGDPKYSGDPKYRAEVEHRVSISDLTNLR
jgi:hypothetical protein